MAEPSLIGVIDTYGIELIHPRREGRSDQQIGKKGLSNKRWIVGCKLCYVINHLGQIVDWDVDTANVYDGSAFQDIVERNDDMVLFADEGFTKKDWQFDRSSFLLIPSSSPAVNAPAARGGVDTARRSRVRATGTPSRCVRYYREACCIECLAVTARHRGCFCRNTSPKIGLDF